MATPSSKTVAYSLILILLYFNLITTHKAWVQAFGEEIESEIRHVSGSDEVGDLLKPSFHFRPPKNWVNDPNGPMYYNGIYHLFYQHNPTAPIWEETIVWAHSVSTDLINWMQLEHALLPTDSFDLKGCWSGSITILPGNVPVILYTGNDSKNRQVQNIAVPKNLSDPFLREWTKSDYNPVMIPTDGTNVTSFRDPTTAWLGQDGQWRVLIGSMIDNSGAALLYKSKDFISWTQAENPLLSEPGSGMWECPDFFPVSLTGKKGLDTSVGGNGVKHVLKVSLFDTFFELYTVGQYFPNEDSYAPDNTSAADTTWRRLDYGKFYASKSFFDTSKNRRVLLGWVNESDTMADSIAKGWAGIQAIPRTLWLDTNGKQILQWPIEELETLRADEVQLKHIPLPKGSLVEVQGITAAQADVEVTFQLPSLENAEEFDPTWIDTEWLCGEKNASIGGAIGPFGLLTLASSNLEEYTAVFFRVFKAQDKHIVLMCSGGKRSSLKEDLYKPSYGGFVDVDLSDGKLSLKSLIDKSVVESFGAEGKTCVTSRVYPTLAVGKDTHLYVFNNGTETLNVDNLKAWTMKNTKMTTSMEEGLRSD